MKQVIFLLLICLNLNAGWGKGTDFVSDMNEYVKYLNGQKYEYVSAGIFTGYVSGVRDTMIDANYICIPSGSNGNQIFQIVIKWVKDNPKEWNNSSSYLVETPLLDAFPCKRKK